MKPKKNKKNNFSIDPGRPKGRFLDGPGGRGADFRRYLADFIRSPITLCTPAGCGGCFLMHNWYFWTPGSIDSAILVVFGRYRKIVIFYVGPGWLKNEKKSILSRPRDPRVTPGIARVWHFSAQPPPGKHHLSKKLVNQYKKPVF